VVRQALKEDSARLAKVQAGLVTAAKHSWANTALAYFDLYDALYAEFWGLDTTERHPAYAWSTQAFDHSETLIAASSVLAQTLARVMLH
jgi:hypothetical protein